MAGKFDDVIKVKKLSRKIERLLSEKGSYSSEFFFQDNGNFVQIINEDFTNKLLKDFKSYTLDPINRLLIVFYLFNKEGDDYQRNVYYFNPEGFIPPAVIKISNLLNLTLALITDYEIFIANSKSKPSMNTEVVIHFYSF